MFVEYLTKPEGFTLERINISEFKSIGNLFAFDNFVLFIYLLRANFDSRKSNEIEHTPEYADQVGLITREKVLR